tara:strand:+ start:1023 stop:1643 length:621 start_codon:yes stop_codon:yes gene_type:complete
VIGNGCSREKFDLYSLKGKGTVFGCNALYREYEDHILPDYLVAIDTAIIKEIEGSKFPKDRFLNPPEDEKWEPVELHWGKSDKKDWNPARPRSNAGMNAIKEAIKKGFTTIYIFGFDFLVVSEKIAISNIFHGTECYGLDTRANLNDTRNRMNYLGWMIEQNPDVKFHFCYPDMLIKSGIYTPDADNVSIIAFHELYTLLLEHSDV